MPFSTFRAEDFFDLPTTMADRARPSFGTTELGYSFISAANPSIAASAFFLPGVMSTV